MIQVMLPGKTLLSMEDTLLFKMSFFFIAKRRISKEDTPLVIAEIGINHNGNLRQAIRIADSAIESGAELIKHQTHIVEDEMIGEAKKIKPGNSNKNIYEIIKNSSLSEQDEYLLMRHVQKKGKIFISSPFSKAAVDRLVKFNVPAFKIGSGECNNYPLIEYISRFKKPVILSTGMNSVNTIKPSVKILKKNKIKFALLHCTNIYPTPHKLVRLNCMRELKKNFPDAIIGLSDHTEDLYCSYAALGLGASIIEKHFTDTKKRNGPDISSSMDKDELKSLISASKAIHAAISYKGKKRPLKEEEKTIKFAYASVVTIKTIMKGDKFSKKNLWVKRPGNGDFLAKDFNYLLGKKAKKNIKANVFLKRKDV